MAKIQVFCIRCSTPKLFKPCEIARGDGKFCSKHCYNAFRAVQTHDGSKHCRKCDQLLPIENFRLRYGRKPGTRLSQCISCQHKNHYTWVLNNPDAAAKINQKARLKKQYGLSVEIYEAMVTIQNNVCAICKRPEKYLTKKGVPKRLSVDHDHKTKKVRGLLCVGCNMGLGKFKDGVLFEAAITYLQKYENQNAL